MAYYLKFLFIAVILLQGAVQASDKVRVAVHIEPPAEDFVDNKFVGRNVEVARTLVAAMGKEVQFTQCPFARCFSMLQKGHVDMLIGLRKTKDRLKTISFLSEPMYYQHFPLRFYVNTKNAIKIESYEDLEDLSIGVLRGGTYFERFDQDKELMKIEVATHKQLVNMLRKKRIDTFPEREESVLPWINKANYDVEFSLAKYQYDEAVASYIGISKKSPFNAEIEAFSATLQKLKASGKHQALFADIE